MRFRKIFLFLGIIFLLSSCTSKNYKDAITLKDTFEWMPVTDDESIEFAVNHPDDFKTFTAFGDKQIYKLTKNQYPYIWLKSKFNLTENLKDQNLGLVISYLHFADELYLNGKYIGSYGRFAPDELNCFYTSHYYGLPQKLLNMEGENTIYIKVYQQGTSGISDKIFVTREQEAKKIHITMSFIRARMYMFFEGGLFFTFLFFLFLYLWIKNRSYLFFAMMNLWTIVFITPFFAYEVPYYASIGIPYLLFIKLTLCCGLFFAFCSGVLFTTEYMGRKLNKRIVIIQCIVLIIEILSTVFRKSYSSLIKVTPFILIIMLLEIGYITVKIVKESNSENGEIRKKARILSVALAPLGIGILLDVILRTVLHNAEFPFFSVLFFQITIMIFIYILTRDIYSVYKHEEYLNTQLQKEVEKQTQSLINTNQILEEEMIHSRMDLEMAAVVQQKSLPIESCRYRGWEIDNSYLPCAMVSGDLFDLYSGGFYNEKFLGGGLFDVSGHGLSAGLITMLSRDVIERAFHSSLKTNEPMVFTLNNINDRLNHSKGNIDNYLTGVLFKVQSFDSTDSCNVELANAGHPYPLLYSAKNHAVIEIKPDDGGNYYGAIGIQDVDVSYSTTYFTMGPGDILFCYTDGITEALNKDGNEFGKQRFIDFILSAANKTSTEIVSEFENVILSYIGDARRTDDISLLIFKRIPSIDEVIEEI